jgi:hypothetical protein
MHFLTAAGTSVVIPHVTEPRHPKIMELGREVQSLVADLTDQFCSRLPCDMQASSNPQTVASPVDNVLAACSTCRSVALATVAVCRGML